MRSACGPMRLAFLQVIGAMRTRTLWGARFSVGTAPGDEAARSWVWPRTASALGARRRCYGIFLIFTSLTELSIKEDVHRCQGRGKSVLVISQHCARGGSRHRSACLCLTRNDTALSFRSRRVSREVPTLTRQDLRLINGEQPVSGGCKPATGQMSAGGFVVTFPPSASRVFLSSSS